MNDSAASSEQPDLLRPRSSRLPLWVRFVCLGGAAVCFVLGIVGWLVPVVTGIPFYVAALVLLGIASDRVRRAINRMERRLPEHLRRKLREALARVRSRHIRRLVYLPDSGADDSSS